MENSEQDCVDVMVDLEAMAQDLPNAAIVVIGAVSFIRSRKILVDRFQVPVCLESSMASGGEVNASTILWWMRQNEAARAAFSDAGLPLGEALEQFDAWLEKQGFEAKRSNIWGNGADFDLVILKQSYRRLGRREPWHFRDIACYRTLKKEYPAVPFKPPANAHCAADDAEAQVRHLLAIDSARQNQAGLLGTAEC